MWVVLSPAHLQSLYIGLLVGRTIVFKSGHVLTPDVWLSYFLALCALVCALEMGGADCAR